MHPLAHHTGEDTLTPLLLVGGTWLSLSTIWIHDRLATLRAKITRPRTRP